MKLWESNDMILDNPSEHFINYILELTSRETRVAYVDNQPDKEELCFHELKIQIKEREVFIEVFIKDELIQLNHLEFDTLYYLAIHHGQVLSKEQIYEAVWKLDYENSSQSVINNIYQLRKKIEPDPTSPMYIKTVIGVGYKFIDQGE